MGNAVDVGAQTCVIRDRFAGGHGTFDNTMLPGRVIRKVRNSYSFAPKALFKFDWMELIDVDALPSRTIPQRWRLRKALRRY